MADVNHVVKLKKPCRALVELKATRELTGNEYQRFRRMVADVGLEGAPFDDASWVYPLVIPRTPRVTVFSEEPREVAVGLRLAGRGFVGVVGGGELEAACLAHAGSILYIVCKLEEKRKAGRTFLNAGPRGWLVVEA